MRFLLDSHTLIWAVDDPTKLSRTAEALILDPNNVRLLSTATYWEIAIKVALGKLPLSMPYRPWMDKAIADLRLEILPTTLDHAERMTVLPFHHNDPFDRVLAAQALAESIPLLSTDVAFDPYGVNRVW